MAHKMLTKDDLPRLMPRREVAEHLGVAEGTLRNWNSAGRVPAPVKYGTSTVRYVPDDAEEWVRDCREPMLA
ncbi:helix-turn-helix transcriptional regulator [Nesterenkonia populi]